jgi:hypothetical protein
MTVSATSRISPPAVRHTIVRYVRIPSIDVAGDSPAITDSTLAVGDPNVGDN